MEKLLCLVASSIEEPRRTRSRDTSLQQMENSSFAMISAAMQVHTHRVEQHSSSKKGLWKARVCGSRKQTGQTEWAYLRFLWRLLFRILGAPIFFSTPPNLRTPHWLNPLLAVSAPRAEPTQDRSVA